MSQDREYIDQEIAQIRFIYETLYPETPVETHMWWEKAKLPTRRCSRRRWPMAPR
ncbi:hypothetical protein ACM258_18860 [Phaeobacter piscinae]|uniref:hypothetical protein n=1 Tax=Phaeobacter piscinae TaxID=1580596 RepID=UPI0039F6D847